MSVFPCLVFACSLTVSTLTFYLQNVYCIQGKNHELVFFMQLQLSFVAVVFILDKALTIIQSPPTPLFAVPYTPSYYSLLPPSLHVMELGTQIILFLFASAEVALLFVKHVMLSSFCKAVFYCNDQLNIGSLKCLHETKWAALCPFLLSLLLSKNNLNLC